MNVALAPEQMLEELLANTRRTESGCLVWAGRIRPDGYADRTWRQRTSLVHRLAYELTHGPLPSDLTLDHLCHNEDPSCAGGVTCLHRSCLNVRHLEPVPGAVNTRRAADRITHCKSGHPFDEANTYVTPAGHRYCRACNRAAAARLKARNAAAKRAEAVTR